MSSELTGIAIVGMAGRFPEAESIPAWWDHLLAGQESLKRFAADELSPLVPAEQRQHPRYVPVRGVMADADRFDAAFFGISAREARLMDPQQRVFLELCWNALEDAAIDTERFPGTVGVYAGTSNNQYRQLLESQPALLRAAGDFATMLANEKDYVATRVAHRLNLTGPALSIHTACSTSLVAVTQAWYALMSWQCDLALAGGINIVVPQESGYIPVDGGMQSADGHCRPFDADANGTVFSSGGGVVVLKRVEEALADGDTIYAVIRGVGVNNDGGDKASFSAPSVRGQAAAIRQALATAGVDAGTIGYVEAHGTGTPLGDPIEVEALTRAFREDTDARQFCGLGSVKGNVGHLNAASGISGLIKAALALYHERIPATVHYRQPNPEIDFQSSPFKIVDRVTEWPRGAKPRRAGVSSFGVGGTNAHVVLEEAPVVAERAESAATRPFPLLPLSARDESALRHRGEDLDQALRDRDDMALADVAYTLAMGRRAMPLRAAVIAADIDGARERLRQLKPSTVQPSPRLVFLFPGQGSQHAGMARELVDSEAVFRESFERCCELASAHLDRDLRSLILPEPGEEEEAGKLLAETRYTQPALFAVEYSLAELWTSWGLRQDTMIGHSIGEYVAAARAGVFALEDAVRLVVARGAAMHAQPPGAMLAVRAGAEAVTARLPKDIEISGYNTPSLTIVSGTHEAVEYLAAALEKDEIACTRLRVSHAFHSASMEGALKPFRKAFDGVQLQAPRESFYSCVSGEPVTAEQATSPDYWCRQIRQPVRFADALQHAASHGWALFLELGPSQALTGLARSMLAKTGKAQASLGPAAQPGNAAEHAATALGVCWSHGLEPDWNAYYQGQGRRRLPLPGYPFRGERYWIEPEIAAADIPNGNDETRQGHEIMKNVTPERSARLKAELRELFEDLSGEHIEAGHDDVSFLDLGFDSLALTQAALEIERAYGLKLKFRRLLEDLDSIDKLASLLDEELPAETASPGAVQGLVESASAASGAISVAAASQTPGNSGLEQLIQSQMALMAQQTELLRALAAGSTTSVPSAGPIGSPVSPKRANEGKTDGANTPADLEKRPFGAAARISRRRNGDLTAPQQAWLPTFVARYVERTAKSKAFSQEHRALMADPRVVTGFDPRWKELVYPIVVKRSSGARMWDLDDNEYIDLLNSFGVNFLGYQPDYIKTALHEQIEAGYEIGPQHPLTAEVSELISDMTGMPRVAFCNTGSEAVMGAMRIARTVTGRDTIVIFKDSYHGIFDEVIVHGTRNLRSIAAAPGILASAVENVLVLEYGSDEALRVIRERAHELAAVMIEPVQGRNPTLQPHAFVRELRTICNEGGCALIFDEVITGFRLAQGGAQELYGVRADIATYGKIIGGGLPFAAIAGQAKWMDALDGGFWRFGDDSYPEAGVTYFAGTFVRHPLALAAAKAALIHLKQRGPQLQRQLNARTQAMVEHLNTFFRSCDAPIDAICASSLWRTRVDADQPCASLFYYALRERGLHVYEQFNFFLSEAHGEDEVETIVKRIEETTNELMHAGILIPRGHGTEVNAKQTPAPAVTAQHMQVETQHLPNKVPLTDAQMERWLACQYNENALLACNESTSSEYRGALDVQALQRALDFVVSRHEVLAMRFLADGSGQVWEPPCKIHLQHVDLSDAADPDMARVRFVEDQASAPFDLTQPPLLRAHLLRLADDHHVLLITAHHIVMDGWAWSIFSEELAATYNALESGVESELPAADSWRRFVLDERSRRDGLEGEASRQWWLRQYREMPEPLNLPTDRPRGKVITFDAGTVALRFDAQLTSALRQAARTRRVTLFTLLLSGFYALLHRLCGQDDLVCGIPFAGQAVSRFKRVMGDSDNTLPLRTVVHPDDSFVALLRRVHGALLDAAEHQDISLGRIANYLNCPRNTGRLPLAEVLFNLNPIVPDIVYQGVDHRHRDLPKIRTNWDLAFHFNERDDSLDLLLHYNRNLFEEATCAYWARALRLLLQRAIESPDVAVEDLPLMDVATRRMLLEDWNDTAVEYDRDQGLTALIEAQMLRTPKHIAVECDGEKLDYAALDQASRAVAQSLARRGLGRGDLVGICVPRTPHMLVAVLGVLRSGAAYVPLDPDFPTSRLEYMAEHARLGHVLMTREDMIPAGVVAGRELLSVPAMMEEPVDGTALPEVGGDDLAYVLFTSGSTGRPKGVRIVHRNLVNFLTSMSREPGFGNQDCLCAVTTLSFDIAGLELYLPLITGGRMVIATEEQHHDPQALNDLIERTGCTVLQTTPSMLRLLQDADRPEMLAGLRLFIGGEALPLELVRGMAGRCRELWNMYGPTETTIWSTLARMRPDMSTVPLGKPIANTRIYVLDDHLQPVYPGAVGEIWIAGDGVADGYLHRPDLTAERFLDDPFIADGTRMYRTGDLGSWHDGVLHFHGRADHQIKIRGYRIEPGDIEAAADSHSSVRECVVVAHHFADNDVRLVLYAAAQGDRGAVAKQLREYLRERLPAYMLPQHIELLDALPKTPNGKIDRKALPQPAAAAVVRESVAKVEQDETVSSDARQSYIAALWREMIGVEDVRADDNFFDLGGHSLLAVEFAARVQHERSVRLRLMDIATGTLASIAAELPLAAEEIANTASSIPLLRRVRLWLRLGEGA